MRGLESLLALRIAWPIVLTGGLLRTRNVLTSAVELAQGGAQRFNFAFVSVFLNFGFLESLESFLHFEQQEFEIAIDPLQLIDCFPNGRSCFHAAWRRFRWPYWLMAPF